MHKDRFALAVLLIAVLSTLLLSLASCGRDKAASPVSEPSAVPEKVVVAAGAPPALLTASLDGTTVTLNWADINPGDYNLDHLVSGLDVFLLAAHFGEAVDHTPGNECIDGNGDGTLDGLDLFPIAANFASRIDGWNVYLGSEATGPFDGEPLNLEPVAYQGCNAQAEWQHEIAEGETAYFAVRSVDAVAGEMSEVSMSATPPPPPLEIDMNLDFTPENLKGAVLVMLSATGTGGDPLLEDCRFEIDWGDGSTIEVVEGVKPLTFENRLHIYGPRDTPYEIELTFSDINSTIVESPEEFTVLPPPLDDPADGEFWLDTPDQGFSPGDVVRINGYIQGPDYDYRGAIIKVATVKDCIVPRTGDDIATTTPLWSPIAISLIKSSEDLEDPPDNIYWITAGEVEITLPELCHGSTSGAEWISQMEFLVPEDFDDPYLMFVTVPGRSNTFFNDCLTTDKHLPTGFRSLIVYSE